MGGERKRTRRKQTKRMHEVARERKGTITSFIEHIMQELS
jgi:hypothetical protein